MILISVGEEIMIKQEKDRLRKKQNMLRHMDISDNLIELLLLRILESGAYTKEIHFYMFTEVSRFLFMYCLGNESNQRSLSHHMTFLVSLMDLDVPTPKLVSQVIAFERETDLGLKFLHYLTEEYGKSSANLNPLVFKLLALSMTRSLTSTPIEANQIFAQTIFR